MGIGGYHHLVSLFQAMPYDVSDKDRKHISESLQKAITSGSFGMVNSTFTSQLDAGLSDPKVRQHLLEAVKNDPKAVDQKMGELINHPDRTAALIMALPTGANVPAPVQVAQNAPAAVAAAPSIKHHYNHHSSAAPVVNAPVNDASDDDTPTVEASNAKPTTGTAKPPAQVAAQVEDNNSFHPPGAASANGGFDLGGMIGKLFSSDAGAGMKSFLTDNTFGKMLGGLLAMFIPGLDKMLSGGQSTDAKGQPAM